MKKKKHNAPQKGQKIKVEPITDLEHIKLIKRMLENEPRNLALFVVGINTALRASDLVRIKTEQVRNMQGDHHEIELKEKKTKKNKRVTLNPACVKVIKNLLATKRFRRKNPKYLFCSRKQSGQDPLYVSSVHRLVKSWCKTINLKGNYGSHSLRKTWGYHKRVTYKTDIPTLMVCLNHSNQKQTLDYLCIQPEEIKEVYMSEL